MGAALHGDVRGNDSCSVIAPVLGGDVVRTGTKFAWKFSSMGLRDGTGEGRG